MGACTYFRTGFSDPNGRAGAFRGGTLAVPLQPHAAVKLGMASIAGGSLAAGEAALEAGDWVQARSLFARARRAAVAAESSYGLARAEERAGDFEAAIRLFEEAFVLFRRQGQVRLPALIAGRELSFLYASVYGNSAAADGWLRRAVSLLSVTPDCPEAGWVYLAECLATRDPARIEQLAAAATTLGRRFGDPGLEFCGRSYEGMALVLGGRLTEGMALVDEAATAATAGEVRDYEAAGEIYCKMLLCTELTLDVRRAEQWMDVADRFGRQAHAAWVPAICGTHYGGILTAAGHWPEAEARLEMALRNYAESFRALRSAALVRLADLRLRQSRLEDSAALLSGLESRASAVRTLAGLWLARGELDRATRALLGLLRTAGGSSLRAPDLALLAEAHVLAGRLEDAAGVAAELSVVAAKVGLAQYRGLAEHAAGLRWLAAGDSRAREHLEAAVESFRDAGLPLEQARSRLALARSAAAQDPDFAVEQSRLALSEFQRLGAASDADAAAQHLRFLGRGTRSAGRIPGPLTGRELRVLELIAEGESNTRIAARLFISKRTVEHHVGSILAKLGLHTRGEIQAYAHRRGLVPRG